MKTSILLIEKKRAESQTFYSGLVNKGYQVVNAANGSEALEQLKIQIPDLIVVNAASIRSTGQRICKSVRQVALRLPIVLIMDGQPEKPENVDADVVLALPFTLQKLLNRIRTLLPGEAKNVLQIGLLQLDMENRFIRCHDRQVSLTPRLVALLKVLMERPGEVVERKELFREVWDTNYTEDMRTLDVHISWLRQLIEDDPRRPKFIKTVRGVGYWLDANGS
jgi:DNA-binding response OmpR family regulator